MHRQSDESAPVDERAGAAETLVSTNPATGEQVWSGETGDAAAEVAAARAAWPAWAAHSHAYWSGPAPCSMHIEEVEAIWAAIAERDDWRPFEDKVRAVRRMGEAMDKDAPAA